MKMSSIDHVVLYANDIDVTVGFYERVLGMTHVVFQDRYRALHFGDQKFNLHDAAHPFSPHAPSHAAGGLDMCFLTDDPIDEVVAELTRLGVPIEDGPCPQTGATGSITSVYFRDPDGNLIEVATRD